MDLSAYRRNAPVRGFFEMSMTNPLTHDIRVWLTGDQYAGLLRRAREDERPVSAYVRRLIARDLDESLDHHPHPAMPAAGALRDSAGRLSNED